MSARPTALLATAAAAALLAAGCGGTRTAEQSGGPNAVLGGGARSTPYDPRATPLSCMRADRLPARLDGERAIVIGAGPGAPRAVFKPDAGTAQGAQVLGDAEGAEVIGSALLYTNAGSDALLKRVETCLGEIVGY